MSELLVVVFLLACFGAMWLALMLDLVRNIDPNRPAEYLIFHVYASEGYRWPT